MEYSLKFENDYSNAKKYEIFIKDFLIKKGYTFKHFSDDYYNDIEDYKNYDILMNKNKDFTIEVKSDKQSHTSNIAIEYNYKGKPSGILRTKSDLWFNIFPFLNEIWTMKSDELREFCIENGHKVIGGDKNLSNLYIMKRDWFKENYKGLFQIIKTEIPIYND